MIAVVSNVDGEPPFTISTKSVEVESGSRAARILTRKILRTEKVQLAGDDQPVPLSSKLQALPSRRDSWQAFVAASLPILEAVTRTYQRRCLRRSRFATYMSRDRALDEICKRVVGGRQATTGRRRCRAGAKDVLVAFGAANACSTGFGYAPAPQGRLRHRLAKLHGAKVFLVDEFNTSQVCCRCHGRLEKVAVTNVVKGRRKLVEPHGLRRCASCRNDKGAPLYCHRDLNAARNIMELFLSEGQRGRGQRPAAFTRRKEEGDVFVEKISARAISRRFQLDEESERSERLMKLLDDVPAQFKRPSRGCLMISTTQ